MSDKEIQVELTEHEARAVVRMRDRDGYDLRDAADKIAAALPPEYPEGTVAWVTAGSGKVRQRAYFQDGKWWAMLGRFLTDLEPVHKVEPLRVLADDEVAVKRDPDGHIRGWHEVAESLRRTNHHHAARVITAYAHGLADALDAEARP